MWLNNGWGKAGKTEATVSLTAFGTSSWEKSVLVLVCVPWSGGNGASELVTTHCYLRGKDVLFL